MNALLQNLSEPVGYTREVYSVDGVRVTLDSRQGWLCTCKRHSDEAGCTHIEQAQVYRAMRGAARDEDTIQLHLTGADLQALVGAPAIDLNHASPALPARRRRRRLHMSRFGAVAAAAAVAALSSGITYLATARTHAIPTPEPLVLAGGTPQAPEPTPQPESLPVNDIPVTFVNPFDRTEVFEFPATTTESDARQAVADFLLQRAKGRIGSSPEIRARAGKSADRHRPARSTSFAQRS